MLLFGHFARGSLIDRVNCMGNGNTLSEKGRHMATSRPVSGKSAEDELLESFGDLIDEAAKQMTDKEFEEAAKRSAATLDRAIAAHSRRRGTA
jgi:hypothetical protein